MDVSWLGRWRSLQPVLKPNGDRSLHHQLDRRCLACLPPQNWLHWSKLCLQANFKSYLASKLTDRQVCRQLIAFLEQENFLPARQSAYRKYQSTETAILKIVSNALLAADRGEITLLGLLYLFAAFDTVRHDILFECVNTSFDVRGSARAWINSFIRYRTQAVVFNCQRSIHSTLDCGVPQGCVLGLILFLLHRADVTAIA